MKTIGLVFVLTFSSVLAEDLFVTPGGAGVRDGSSWANAFADLSGIAWGEGQGKVGAGDTLWVAGGRYTTTLRIGASGTSNARVEIKRVKASDSLAVATPGWKTDFDSQAVIDGPIGACILFSGGIGNFVTIDGREKYGIKCLFKDGGSGVEIDATSGTLTNITLQYIEAAGPGPITQTSDTRGFDLTITGTIANLRMSYCSAHHCDTTFQITRSTGLIVEHCDFYDAFAVNTAVYHPNTMILTQTNDAIIRFNRMYNIWVEGLFFESGVSDNVLIYGNQFSFGNVTPGFAGRGLEFGSNAVGTNFKIYNNTFVGLPFVGLRLNGISHAGTVVKNNIFYNCRAEFGGVEHDYNLFSGANSEPNGIGNAPNPFASPDALDFRLDPSIGPDRARNRGQELNAPFDVDRAGNLRGADGAWDIGAYEFVPPGAPAILSNNVVVGSYRVPFEYKIIGSNAPTAYRVNGVPPTGIAFNGVDTLKGTPTQAGVWEVTLAATNEIGTGAAILSFAINPAVLRATGLIVNDRPYDKTTMGRVNTEAAGLDGIAPQDLGAVILTATEPRATFPSSTVGAGEQRVAISGLALTGPAAANYVLASPSVTARITPAELSVSGIVASNKVFDGTITATLSVANARVTGVLTGDSINLTGATGKFSDSNAGTNKSVVIDAITFTGSGSSNYVLSSAPVTGTIAPANATITLNDLVQSFDGAAKAVTVATTPAGLATAVTYDGGTSPPISVGRYAVVATITEPNYRGTRTDFLEISASTFRPTITSSDFFAGTVGKPFAYTISATEGPTTFGATGLPAGLSINTTTGTITGTPTAASTQTVTLSAANAGGTGNMPLTLVVAPAGSGRQTVSFSVSPTPVRIGEPVTLQATATSGLPVRFSVVSGNARSSGNAVTVYDTNPVVVRATQPGDAAYAAANAELTLHADRNSFDVMVFFGNMGSDPMAAVVSPDNRSGRLLVRDSRTGEALIADLTIAADGSFQGTAPAGVLSATSAIAATAGTTGAKRTFRGRSWGGSIVGVVAEIGAGFTATLQPRDGVTATFAGIYAAPITASASGTTHLVMGADGQTYALAVTPALVTAGMGTLTATGSFEIPSGNASMIRGNTSAESNVVTGTIEARDQPVATFAGTSGRSPANARLVNLSSRTLLNDTDGGQPLIAGFAVSGSSAKRVLLRAIGPGLAGFGVSGTLPNPRLQLYDQQGRLLAENDDWQPTGDIAGITSQSGGFPLAANSQDAAFLSVLIPGVYTIRIDGDGGRGIALAEIYDASEATGSPLLTNISTRGHVGPADGVIVSGIVVHGEPPVRVLIRGIGPGLADFGVSGTLSDPRLELYQNAALLARNDNWGTPQPVNPMQWAATQPEISAAGESVGAFPLRSGSRDAAVVIVLAAGAYTALLSGAGTSSGTGLIEVYLLPKP